MAHYLGFARQPPPEARLPWGAPLLLEPHSVQVELTNVRQCSGRADYTHVKLHLRNGHFLESAFRPGRSTGRRAYTRETDVRSARSIFGFRVDLDARLSLVFRQRALA